MHDQDLYPSKVQGQGFISLVTFTSVATVADSFLELQHLLECAVCRRPWVPKDAWGYRGCSQCPSTLTHIPLWEFLELESSHRVCLFLKPSKCHFVSISIQTPWTLGFLGSCNKLPSPGGHSKTQVSSVVVWDPGCALSEGAGGEPIHSFVLASVALSTLLGSPPLVETVLECLPQSS